MSAVTSYLYEQRYSPQFLCGKPHHRDCMHCSHFSNEKRDAILAELSNPATDYETKLFLVNRMDPSDPVVCTVLGALQTACDMKRCLEPAPPTRTPLLGLLERLNFLLWDYTGFSAMNVAANRDPYALTWKAACFLRHIYKDTHVSLMTQQYLYTMYGPNRLHYKDSEWAARVVADPFVKDKWLLYRYAEGCQ